MDTQAETRLAGRYRLLRKLGEGGVAEVWLGHDERMDRPVALKVLRRQYLTDPTLLARFRREALLAARLDSPHIVRVYDLDTSGASPFIVMEYVEGEDLRALLQREGPLSVRRALTLLRDVAAGIAVAHAAGLVHRDLKPANILLARHGVVKITDFGIARDAAAAALTEPGTLWGTSYYIAPEQALGKVPTPATDVYALGVLLWEMVAGRPPFTGSDPIAVALAHVQQPPPSLQRLAPGVPTEVAELVAAMLAKEPGQRPPHGGAVAQWVNGFLRDHRGAAVYDQPAAPPLLPITQATTVSPAPAAPRSPPSPPATPARPAQPNNAPVLLLLALLLAGLMAVLAWDLWDRFVRSPAAGAPPITITATAKVADAVAVGAASATPTAGPSSPTTLAAVATTMGSGSPLLTPTVPPTLVATPTTLPPTFTRAPTEPPSPTPPPPTPSPPPSATSLSSPTSPPPSATALPPSPTRPPSATPPPPAPTPPARRVGNGPDALAARVANGAIAVDGNLRDWPRQGAVPIATLVDAPGGWDGPGDLSGTAYLAWDDSALYLAIERTDDEHIQTHASYELYRDDAVELWLDTDLRGDFSEAAANGDDFQLAFSAGNFGGLRPEGVIYYPDRNNGRNSAVGVGAAPLGTSYVLEARIPWEVLAVTPAADLALGYAVVLNDNDSPRRAEPQAQVATTLEQPYLRPLTFGNLVLRP